MSNVTFLTDLHLVRHKDRLQSPDRTDVFAVLGAEYRVIHDVITITVPAGFETNLASIPRRLRGIVSLDRGVEAAVVHDWLYYAGQFTKQYSDLVFHDLLRATESAATIWIMYNAVRLGGGGAWKACRQQIMPKAHWNRPAA